jgi:MYXO-CTERM domain-containing protein
MLKLVGLVGVVMLASACGAPAPEDAELGSVRQAIVNGEPSDESDDAVVYVLSRFSASEGTTCTGSLIAPNLVITALHCVTYSSEGTFSCKPDGTIDSDTPGDGQIGQTISPASNVQVFQGLHVGAEPSALAARLIGTGSSQICKNDLALIVLDRELEGPLMPLRLASPVKRGERARVVGYGQTELSGSSGRVRRTGRRVVDVGPENDSDPIETAAPRTFVIDEGPCHGDSGGPAISEETGALLGVYSLAAASTCTSIGVRNVYTRVAPFQTLILNAFAAVGADPVLEEDQSTPQRAPESKGCSLGATGAPSGSAGWGLVLGAVAGLWLARRRSV